MARVMSGHLLAVLLFWLATGHLASAFDCSGTSTTINAGNVADALTCSDLSFTNAITIQSSPGLTSLELPNLRTAPPVTIQGASFTLFRAANMVSALTLDVRGVQQNSVFDFPALDDVGSFFVRNSGGTIPTCVTASDSAYPSSILAPVLKRVRNLNLQCAAGEFHTFPMLSTLGVTVQGGHEPFHLHGADSARTISSFLAGSRDALVTITGFNNITSATTLGFSTPSVVTGFNSDFTLTNLINVATLDVTITGFNGNISGSGLIRLRNLFGQVGIPYVSGFKNVQAATLTIQVKLV